MARKTASEAAPADSSSAPDFGDMAAQASAPASSGDSMTALDDLAASMTRETVRVPADTLETMPGAGEPSPAPRSSSETARPRRGRPPRTDGGRTRAGEPRTTKTELLAEVEQLRARLEAAEARSDTDKVAELSASFRMLSHVGFALLGEARGPHWRTTPDEDKTLGDSFAVAAAPHAEAIEAQLPWAAPVLALVGVVGKRVIEDVRIARLSAPVAVVADGPALGTGPVSAP